MRTRSAGAAISVDRRSLCRTPEVKDAFRPESLLPLKVSESQARDLIRAWYRTPVACTEQAAIRERSPTPSKGVYLPYWTFDANAHAAWTAESGSTTT